MPLFDTFFRDLDRAWGKAPSRGPITLRVIGSAALMLQTDYERGTSDGDILETVDLTVPVKARLLELAGRASPLHRRHGIYLDVVAAGVPFLPQVPRWHPHATLNGSLSAFEVEVLDVVDVVVSKLKRFHANDQSDVEAMVDRALVAHGDLVARFRSAVEVFSGDARAEDLPRYVQRLHRVERDLFGAPESLIELPGWIDDD